MPPVQSFPRHNARTQGFTLGTPRNISLTREGEAVLFLRSSSGTDRSNCLWMTSTRTGEERMIADPTTLRADEQVTAQEQARRERARERATGITSFAIDNIGRIAVFGLSGRLFVTDLFSETTRELPAKHPVTDPRPDPTGEVIAYLSGRTIRLINADGSGDRGLAESEQAGVTWGAAEFIAAEEMDRDRGYWWSPDGTSLLAARVDETEVTQWYLSEATDPAQTPTTMRYPAAGTTNAEVTLACLGLNGSSVDVSWDRDGYPYLVAAHWSSYGPPLIAVQSRDQRTQLVLRIDPDSGQTHEVHRDTDPFWIEIKPGWPAWSPDGKLVTIAAREGSYRLVVDGKPWTEQSLQVRSVLDIADNDVLVSASGSDPAEVHLYRASPHGTERLTHARGVHTGVRSGQIMVITSAGFEELDAQVRIFHGTSELADIGSHADKPELTVRVELLSLGERSLRSALVLPSDYHPDQGKLPVLIDSYGGPQAQRVLARQRGYLASQWFADQGFAVLVTDGRGMAGRGPNWDRAIAGDLAGPPLEDQVDALHAAAAHRPELDLTRVAIRGWSFGGYLAALAALRRPDVFHAAIAGAAVCDWRLYDTHYTERYLGDPNQAPDAYESSSLLSSAAELRRPLLIIHGTVDDNVVTAHSLRLSAALTAAARPHTMLPLPGVSHVPTDENTVENLLLMQISFLHQALSTDP